MPQHLTEETLLVSFPQDFIKIQVGNKDNRITNFILNQYTGSGTDTENKYLAHRKSW